MCSMRWRRPRAGAGSVGRRALEGVERHANGAIADRVNHHLPAAAVEIRDQPIECFA